MVGRRKKPKADAPQQESQKRQAGYRDWDTIIPGEPMAPQPYADAAPRQAPQPQAPQPPPPPPQSPAYQPPPQSPAYQPPPQSPAYQSPPQSPAYQSPPQPPAYQPPPQSPANEQPPATPPVAAPAAVNPTDGRCTKCGVAFGQRALCEGCGAGRTACMVCGTKIWAGALTCSAHSNATRR